jgi:hypothetical protein
MIHPIQELPGQTLSEPAQIADGYSASMTLGLKLRHKIETTQHQGKANEAA